MFTNVLSKAVVLFFFFFFFFFFFLFCFVFCLFVYFSFLFFIFCVPCVPLWLLAERIFHVFPCMFVVFVDLCVWWILSSFVIALQRKRGWLFCFSIVCGIFTVSHGLFALSLGCIGRLCCMIVSPGT